jgi:multidrug efflux pump
MTSQSRSEPRVSIALPLATPFGGRRRRDKVVRARGKLPDTSTADHRQGRGRLNPIIIAVRRARFTLDASDCQAPCATATIRAPGAADVRIFGERQISMRINLDRTRLAAYKLTVQDVEDAIRKQNGSSGGRIESTSREFTVVAGTDTRTPEQFNNIIVANVGGYRAHS